MKLHRAFRQSLRGLEAVTLLCLLPPHQSALAFLHKWALFTPAAPQQRSPLPTNRTAAALIRMGRFSGEAEAPFLLQHPSIQPAMGKMEALSTCQEFGATKGGGSEQNPAGYMVLNTDNALNSEVASAPLPSQHIQQKPKIPQHWKREVPALMLA